MNERERAIRWISGHGECGLSSECIWRTMMGVAEPRDGFYAHAYPSDPDDFRRCWLLLREIPEWRPRIGEMAKHGAIWKRLAERWDEIEALFVEEAGNPGRYDGWSAPRTYGLMKEIQGRQKRRDRKTTDLFVSPATEPTP